MSDQRKQSLGDQAAIGAIWSVGSQGVTVILQFLSVSILARLVTPEDFGMLAVVMAIIGFGELFRDFGLSNAAIRSPTLSMEESSNLFWANIGIGAILGIGFFAVSGPIAQFYGEPLLQNVVRVLSFTFLLNGISAQPRVILTRHLNMQAIAKIDITSSLLGLVVGVAMAMLGLGYWAIAGMTLSRFLANAILSNRFSPFKMTFPTRHVSINQYVRVGSELFGANIINYLSQNIDSLIIGKLLGTIPLGFYSRAYQLSFMPVQQLAAPLQRVVLPSLAKLSNDDRRYLNFLLRAQSALLITVAGGYAIALIFGDYIIRLALGPGWDSAVPVFRILCAAGMFSAAHYVSFWIFLSKARTGVQLKFVILSRPILIFAILLMAPFGLEAIAWSYVAWFALAWPPGLYWAAKDTTVPVFPLLSTAARTLGIALLVIFVGLSARNHFDNQSASNQVLFTSAIISFVVLITLLVLRGFREEIRESVALIMRLKRPQTTQS